MTCSGASRGRDTEPTAMEGKAATIEMPKILKRRWNKGPCRNRGLLFRRRRGKGGKEVCGLQSSCGCGIFQEQELMTSQDVIHPSPLRAYTPVEIELLLCAVKSLKL